MTNLIPWNCRGLMNKRDEIWDIISDYQPIIFAHQETYLKRTDKVTFHGYNCFRKDFRHSERATGGIALLNSNDFPYTVISFYINIRALAEQIHIHQIACTIYLASNFFNRITKIISLCNYSPLLSFLVTLMPIALLGES